MELQKRVKKLEKDFSKNHQLSWEKATEKDADIKKLAGEWMNQNGQLLVEFIKWVKKND